MAGAPGSAACHRRQISHALHRNTCITRMDIKQYIHETGRRAREASRRMAGASTAAKNSALTKIAGIIVERQKKLLEANLVDLQAARENGMDAAMLDRLELTRARINAMADGLHQVAQLEDPIG